jgi:drug/metabolite transporter (DMT)-like permease
MKKNCQNLLPFIFNQIGSLMFYYLLANEPVIIASPLCNSLTFTITSITAYYLGERSQSPLFLFLGITLVLLGTYISFLS